MVVDDAEKAKKFQRGLAPYIQERAVPFMLEDYSELYERANYPRKRNFDGKAVGVRHSRAIETPAFLLAVHLAETTQASVTLQIGDVMSMAAMIISSRTALGDSCSSNNNSSHTFSSSNSSGLNSLSLSSLHPYPAQTYRQ